MPAGEQGFRAPNLFRLLRDPGRDVALPCSAQVSTLGPAAALAVLALTPEPRLGVAMGCLTAALALQAFCSAGFHPYIQARRLFCAPSSDV